MKPLVFWCRADLSGELRFVLHQAPALVLSPLVLSPLRIGAERKHATGSDGVEIPHVAKHPNGCRLRAC